MKSITEKVHVLLITYVDHQHLTSLKVKGEVNSSN